MLALRLITEAAEPIRDAPLLPQVLNLMSNSPIFGVIAGGILTVLCASSIAVVLLVASLVKAGLLPVPLRWPSCSAPISVPM